MPASLQHASSDPTVELPPPDSATEWSDPRCQHVALVEGSRPHLTSETTAVLRVRLRAAATMLLLAFSAALLVRLVNPKLLGEGFLQFQVSLVLLLALVLVLLCRRCPLSMGSLRVYEALIFIVPSVYLIFAQHEQLRYWSESKGFVPSPLGPWMGLMFIYALFIPNTWQRAALKLAPMAIAPNALIAYMWSTHELSARFLNENPTFVVQPLLMLGVTYVIGVYGTHVINQLRREAFEARRWGQYKLCRMLGRGGMGEVYLAEHQMMKRPCAIKVIRPGKAADPYALARFEREVRATAKLSHWNTIEIFDYGRTEDGTFYYVMEFLPGLNLGDLVERHGPLPPSRVIHLLRQTCEALSEAHSHGLIHRDIKPGNIFAAKRGGVHDVAKLLDFGLAKPMFSSTDTHLTLEGSITGSPLFMSPEQATGETEPDARSDIYSLGATAYYLLTGTPPFSGDKPIQVILAHAQQEVVPPSKLRSEVPTDLERVVLRCLAKRPDDRFADALSLAEALAACEAAGGWSRGDASHWWQTQERQTDECQKELEAIAL